MMTRVVYVSLVFICDTFTDFSIVYNFTAIASKENEKSFLLCKDILRMVSFVCLAHKLRNKHFHDIHSRNLQNPLPFSLLLLFLLIVDTFKPYHISNSFSLHLPQKQNGTHCFPSKTCTNRIFSQHMHDSRLTFAVEPFISSHFCCQRTFISCILRNAHTHIHSNSCT